MRAVNQKIRKREEGRRQKRERGRGNQSESERDIPETRPLPPLAPKLTGR